MVPPFLCRFLLTSVEFVLLLSTGHATVSVIFRQYCFLQSGSLSPTQEHYARLRLRALHTKSSPLIVPPRYRQVNVPKTNTKLYPFQKNMIAVFKIMIVIAVVEETHWRSFNLS